MLGKGGSIQRGLPASMANSSGVLCVLLGGACKCDGVICVALSPSGRGPQGSWGARSLLAAPSRRALPEAAPLPASPWDQTPGESVSPTQHPGSLTFPSALCSTGWREGPGPSLSPGASCQGLWHHEGPGQRPFQILATTMKSSFKKVSTRHGDERSRFSGSRSPEVLGSASGLAAVPTDLCPSLRAAQVQALTPTPGALTRPSLLPAPQQCCSPVPPLSRSFRAGNLVPTSLLGLR